MSLSSPPLVGELFEGTLSEILYVQEVPILPDVPVVLDSPRFVGEAELQDLINEIPKPSVEFQPSPSYISSCSIEEIEKRCILNSETKFYHILAGKGVLRTSLHFSGFESIGGQFLICSRLERMNEQVREYPVMKMCKKHPGKAPLKAADSEEQTLFTSTMASGTFLLYKNVTHLMKGLQLDCDMKLQFPCWSKCVNSDNAKCITTSGKFCKENARDMVLQIFLIEETDTCVIERSAIISIPISVQAIIGSRDIEKKTKRKSKGSRTQIEGAIKKSRTPSLIIENLKRSWATMSPEEKEAARAVTSQE